MSTVLDPPVRPPRTYMWSSVADLLVQLGDIPAGRVRMDPLPGTATLEDLIEANERKDGPICELIDGTLVEKTVGWYESWLTCVLIGEIYTYQRANDIGFLLGPDGVMEVLPGIGRAPDVALVRWDRLPGGRPPARDDRVPALAPDLAVEVLSESNRPSEMARKRDEYFRAGVARVWEIEPDTRTARVYTAAETFTDIPADGVLDGEHLLPGFRLSLADLFTRADGTATP